MSHIKISKGLNIPLKGRPSGIVQPLSTPTQLALNLDAFENIKFRLLVNVGDVVKIGQPLAEDKETQGRMFVSPASGKVNEIRRGLKTQSSGYRH